MSGPARREYVPPDLMKPGRPEDFDPLYAGTRTAEWSRRT
jgi:hypothetical protein